MNTNKVHTQTHTYVFLHLSRDFALTSIHFYILALTLTLHLTITSTYLAQKSIHTLVLNVTPCGEQALVPKEQLVPTTWYVIDKWSLQCSKYKNTLTHTPTHPCQVSVICIGHTICRKGNNFIQPFFFLWVGFRNSLLVPSLCPLTDSEEQTSSIAFCAPLLWLCFVTDGSNVCPLTGAPSTRLCNQLQEALILSHCIASLVTPSHLFLFFVLSILML